MRLISLVRFRILLYISLCGGCSRRKDIHHEGNRFLSGEYSIPQTAKQLDFLFFYSIVVQQKRKARLKGYLSYLMACCDPCEIFSLLLFSCQKLDTHPKEHRGSDRSLAALALADRRGPKDTCERRYCFPCL
jgi:hypothetical protein